jgi:hypothetical protein
VIDKAVRQARWFDCDQGDLWHVHVDRCAYGFVVSSYGYSQAFSLRLLLILLQAPPPPPDPLSVLATPGLQCLPAIKCISRCARKTRQTSRVRVPHNSTMPFRLRPASRWCVNPQQITTVFPHHPLCRYLLLAGCSPRSPPDHICETCSSSGTCFATKGLGGLRESVLVLSYGCRRDHQASE